MTTLVQKKSYGISVLLQCTVLKFEYLKYIWSLKHCAKLARVDTLQLVVHSDAGLRALHVVR